MDHLPFSVNIVMLVILIIVLMIWVCSGIVYCRETVVTVIKKKLRKAPALDGGETVSDTYSKESSAEEVGGGCAICLCEYEDGDKRLTIAACNHRFHAVCIEAWFEKMYTCPLCRHNLV
ncbi:hypothetical protein C2S51_003264 [Perilla frutescens var. frutescens]|nr:hypothetical protein C2S51_003264 [Perilla frutescens var. frutescens]